jgi:molybdopterin-guanine dinucleotide biosynthesis protein A
MTAPVADDVTVVVLAGGASRRFGSDKLAARLRGSTVMDLLLSGLPAQWRVVAVGPRRPTVRLVDWALEEPPGGGPLAGIQAGLALVGTDLVAVVGGDMPFAGAALLDLVEVLRTAPPDVAAAVGTDGGVANPLLAVYRAAAVREALPRPSHGRAARSLLALPHVEVRVVDVASRDVDTPSDLEALDGPERLDQPGPGTRTGVAPPGE